MFFKLFFVEHHALLLEDFEKSPKSYSAAGKSYNEWKKSLLRGSSPCGPVIPTSQLSSGIVADDIKRYGDQLRENGCSYEALYIYTLAYEEYQHRSDAEGMANTIYWMSVTITEMDRQTSKTSNLSVTRVLEMDKQKSKNVVVAQWQNMAHEAMAILNGLAMSGDEKARQEAGDLYGKIGYLNMEF